MTGLPDKDALLDWLRDNPSRRTKRDIARAFGIKGAERTELKRMLRELEDDGALEKGQKRYREPGTLAPVEVLRVVEIDRDGDIFAEPQNWSGSDAPPRILYLPRDGDPALGEGDRILCRIAPAAGPGLLHHARLIRRIGTGPRRIVGIFRRDGASGRVAGRIEPVEKGAEHIHLVPPGDTMEAEDGELVEAEVTGGPRLGPRHARIIERVGDPSAPRAVSLIAIHHYGIPDDFPDAALREASQAEPPGMDGREDLREIPFVTIDPPDARDRDDAVAAIPDDDPKNPGGIILWVAIADVAHFVRPGSALDREALLRGNSTYFPDRVVPMLPERLSSDLCSLHAEVERAVIAVRMVLSADGQKRDHRFTRGLIRSHAALSYSQAQAAEDGDGPEATCTLIAPLFAAYRALAKARTKRAPLNLDLPERQIALSDAGEVLSVAFRDRFDAHKMIEEAMVLANVAAAETLEAARRPLLYRVHEEPQQDRLDALRETAESVGLTLAKGQVLKTAQLNHLLDAAAGTEFAELINMSVLRAQTQAYYGAENLSHFGLNLRRYAHFTSPIRRYADLVVHRALISAHGWGPDGLAEEEIAVLPDAAEQISRTERRSMQAERDTTDRYLAAYLAERVGESFSGRISGIARFGVFVKLEGSGADGLVPISTIGNEYFRHDAEAQTLTGSRSGRVISLGMPVDVRLAEADPITGGLRLELLAVEGRRTNPGASRKSAPKSRRRTLKKGGRKRGRA
ncbi:MAG: ribonuclease R [Pseudomonadota bacterium]